MDFKNCYCRDVSVLEAMVRIAEKNSKLIVIKDFISNEDGSFSFKYKEIENKEA
jgi:hypothetical protein